MCRGEGSTTGVVVDMDVAAAVFLNLSLRDARGRSLLPYMENGRLDIARDLHAVASVGAPPRQVTLRAPESAEQWLPPSRCGSTMTGSNGW